MQLQVDELLARAKEAYERNDNELAETLGRESLASALALGYALGQGHAHNTIGISFLRRGLLDKALEHFIAAEKLLAEQDAMAAFPSLLNVAIIYNQLKEPQKALATYGQLLQMVAHLPEDMRHAQLYTGIANVHTEMGEYAKALEYFHKTYELCVTQNSVFGQALSLRNMASVLVDMGEAEEAIKNAEQSNQIAQTNDYQQLFLGNVQTIAQCQQQLGRTQEALELLLEHLPKAEALAQLDDLAAHLEYLSKAYEQLGDFEGAYRTQKRWIAVHNEWQNAEKAKTIAQLQLAFETEKKEQQILALQQEYAQAELASLKSRMNPHFIFNVMNSIQSLVYTGDKYKAVEAIGLFADVMRDTLYYSGKQWITLNEELKLVSQYVQLEAMQFTNGFEFKLIIAPDVDTEAVQVPAMLLQPLIENAIKHGLAHLPSEKMLMLSIIKQYNTLIISIEDNGVGRAKSTEINKNRKGHTSFATGSIEKRLALLNKQGQYHVDLTITDKYRNEQPAGTLVTLTLQPYG